MEMNGNRNISYMNEHVKPFFMDGKIKDECILLLHGFTGTPADMRPLAEYLNKNGEGFPVCAILFPGHGTKVEDMLPCNWKDWVIYATGEFKKLQALYSKVSVIGLSMGGDVALCIASRLKVNRIVTISTPIIIRNKLNHIAEFLSIFRKYINWWNYKPLEGEAHFDYETGYKGMPMRSIAQLRKLAIAARNRLPRVRQPILVIQSLKDKLVNHKSPYIIFDNVKSEYKEFTLLEQARHNAINSPDRFRLYAAVEEFLQREILPKEQVLQEASNMI